MKISPAFTVIAIVTCGVGWAAEPPAAPAATPVKHTTLKVCNKQADARKLTGAARAQFVKDCRAGKSS